MRSNSLRSLFFVLSLSAASVLGEDVDCAEAENGEYPYEANCRKFISCFDGTGTVETCTSDWLFSEARGYCDYPETVDCGDRPVCDDDDVSNCEEHHVTTQAPPEECEGVTCDDGEEFVELEPCSQQFCHCSGGVPILDECADGLVFNPEIGACDWPENNPACD